MSNRAEIQARVKARIRERLRQRALTEQQNVAPAATQDPEVGQPHTAGLESVAPPQTPASTPTPELERVPFREQVGMGLKNTRENQLAYLRAIYPEVRENIETGEIQVKGQPEYPARMDHNMGGQFGNIQRDLKDMGLTKPETDETWRKAEPGLAAELISDAPTIAGSAIGGGTGGLPGAAVGASAGNAVKQWLSTGLPGEENTSIGQRAAEAGIEGASTLAVGGLLKGIGKAGKMVADSPLVEKALRSLPGGSMPFEAADRAIVKQTKQVFADSLEDLGDKASVGKRLRTALTETNKRVSRKPLVNSTELEFAFNPKTAAKIPGKLPSLPTTKQSVVNTPEIRKLVRKIQNPEIPDEQVIDEIVKLQPSQLKELVKYSHQTTPGTEVVLKQAVLHNLFEKAFQTPGKSTAQTISRALRQNNKIIHALDPKFFRQDSAIPLLAKAADNITKHADYLEQVIPKQHLWTKVILGGGVVAGSYQDPKTLGAPLAVGVVSAAILGHRRAGKYIAGLAKKNLTEKQAETLVRGFLETLESAAD